MKISFLEKEEFLKSASLSECEAEAVRDFLLPDGAIEGTEVLYAYFSGNVILRYYSDEDGYAFSAPYALTDGADIAAAYIAISEYCKLEEVPEVIVDILEEELPLAKRDAPVTDVYENEDGTYVLSVYTPPMLADDLPECLCGKVYLGEFARSYASEYEKLVKDANLNRHFGYNMIDDVPSGKGEDLIDFVRDEFESGRSMTFAATVLSPEGENVFVGEGALYAFDGRGCASLSFRVLPEYHRQGYGRSILEGLCKIARDIGISRLIGEVMEENLPSNALMRSVATESFASIGKVTYSVVLK